MKRNKKLGRAVLSIMTVLSVLSLAACKPRYRTHLQEPNQTIAANAPQMLDFTQIHNDVLELYSDKEEFGFIKNLDISGSDEAPKTIRVNMDCVEDVSDEAIRFFMSILLQDISNEAVIQDSRYEGPSEESFGTVYNTYALEYKITRGEEVFDDATIDAGEGIPFTPGASIEVD